MDREKPSLIIIIVLEPVNGGQGESGHAAICLRWIISPGTSYGDELRVDSFTFYLWISRTENCAGMGPTSESELFPKRVCRFANPKAGTCMARPGLALRRKLYFYA